MSTAALALFTLVSSAGLLKVFAGHSWVAPVAATALVAHLLLWLLRRTNLGAVVTAAVTAAALILTVSWAVLGSTTYYGLPLAGTWSQAIDGLRNVSHDISAASPPVTAGRDLVLLCTLLAAGIALASDTLAFRLRSPVAALLPGIAGFVACGIAARGAARPALVAAEVAAACVFLLADRREGAGSRAWLGGVRAGSGRWAAGAGMLTSIAAVAVAVAVVPALPSEDGSAAFGWRGAGDRQVPDPVASMQTQLHRLSQVPVFEVDATTSSYWRLTSLNDFNGDEWISTFSTSGFGSRLPGVPDRGAATEKATFEIEQLDSPWLPDQFDPVSVTGAKHISYDAESNSLITSHPTSNGLKYTVTSYRYLSTLSVADLEEAPSTANDPAVAADLELPASVGGPVTQLAQSLTAGKRSEYDKAIAIQDYLRSPLFQYSLDPPSDGSSQYALETFLFQTRTGYCQQFAGAFAVLARAAGIPTRLAVGYTTGTNEGGDLYQVTGADAHTWPEVYFGAGIGWVPFEPTPGFAVPGAGYDPTSTNAGSGTATTPTTVNPATNNLGNEKSHSPTRPTTGATPTTAARPAPTGAPSHSGSEGWLWLLVLPAIAAAWLGGVAASKRLSRLVSRRRAARAGAVAVVLDAWDEVSDELTWRDLQREPAETLAEFTVRALAAVQGGEVTSALAQLSELAGRAVYAPETSDADAEAAVHAAGRIRHGLRATAAPGERMSRSFSPRRCRSGGGAGGTALRPLRRTETTASG